MIDSCEAVTYVILGVLLVLGFVMLLSCSYSNDKNGDEGFRAGGRGGRGGRFRPGRGRRWGPGRGYNRFRPRWPRAYGWGGYYNAYPYYGQVGTTCEDTVKYVYDRCIDVGANPVNCRANLEKDLNKCWFNV